MEAQQALSQIEAGDTITVNDMDTLLTVTDTMFGGEMVELEGPQGGEKSIVQNVNNPEQISFMVRDSRESWVSEIHFQ